MYGVHYLMQSLYRLRYDGTAQIHRTIGERGTVYVPIPPNHEGLGKIQIRTQGRIMEYAARTRGPDKLRTGTTVEVVEILSPMTVDVEPVDAVVPVVRDHVDHDAWKTTLRDRGRAPECGVRSDLALLLQVREPIRRNIRRSLCAMTPLTLLT